MSLVGFPLLLIPLAIINILVFLMPGVSFTDPLASVPLPSGATWSINFTDGLLALSIVLMLFEVLKASRPYGRYLTDHLLALIALGAVIAEFVLLPRFALPVMFLLAVMMAVDFIAGVALRLRQRAAGVPSRRKVRTEAAAAARAEATSHEEPQFTPVAPPPAEPVAPAPSVAAPNAPVAHAPSEAEPAAAPSSPAPAPANSDPTH